MQASVVLRGNVRFFLLTLICGIHRREGSFPAHTNQNNFCAFRVFPWLLSLSTFHYAHRREGSAPTRVSMAPMRGRRPVLWPIVCRSNHRRRGSFPTHTRQNNFRAFRVFPWLLSLSTCRLPLSTSYPLYFRHVDHVVSVLLCQSSCP